MEFSKSRVFAGRQITGRSNRRLEFRRRDRSMGVFDREACEAPQRSFRHWIFHFIFSQWRTPRRVELLGPGDVRLGFADWRSRWGRFTGPPPITKHRQIFTRRSEPGHGRGRRHSADLDVEWIAPRTRYAARSWTAR